MLKATDRRLTAAATPPLGSQVGGESPIREVGVQRISPHRRACGFLRVGFGRGLGPASLTVAILLSSTGCAQDGRDPLGQAPFPRLTGDYLGQPLPGTEPELFAPGVVSTGMYTRDLTMTPAGDEIYFGASVGNFTYATILVARRRDGVWSEPEVAGFARNPAYTYLEPFVHPTGQQLFFVSDQPDPLDPEREDHENIWVLDRTSSGWGPPRKLGTPVNSELAEYFPSVTRDGTLYFTREDPETRQGGVFRCRYDGERYLEAERLPEQINSTPYVFNAYVTADESFVIVPTFGREDSYGHADYYVCFRRTDPTSPAGDAWSEPVNLGPRVNTTRGDEWSCSLSPDGRYFFFMSARLLDSVLEPGAGLTRRRLFEMHNRPGHGLASIYWMEAGFLDSLRADVRSRDASEMD